MTQGPRQTTFIDEGQFFLCVQKEGESSETLHYHQQSFEQTRDSKPNQFLFFLKQVGRAISG